MLWIAPACCLTPQSPRAMMQSTTREAVMRAQARVNEISLDRFVATLFEAQQAQQKYRRGSRKGELC